MYIYGFASQKEGVPESERSGNFVALDYAQTIYRMFTIL